MDEQRILKIADSAGKIFGKLLGWTLMGLGCTAIAYSIMALIR